MTPDKVSAAVERLKAWLCNDDESMPIVEMTILLDSHAELERRLAESEVFNVDLECDSLTRERDQLRSQLAINPKCGHVAGELVSVPTYRQLLDDDGLVERFECSHCLSDQKITEKAREEAWNEALLRVANNVDRAAIRFAMAERDIPITEGQANGKK